MALAAAENLYVCSAEEGGEGRACLDLPQVSVVLLTGLDFVHFDFSPTAWLN